jgi:hypothetical protein
VGRGTYTTQAKGKRENRKSEILMREAEYAATMASLVDSDYEYPKKVRVISHSMEGSNETEIRCCMGRHFALPIPRCPTRKWYRHGQSHLSHF